MARGRAIPARRLDDPLGRAPDGLRCPFDDLHPPARGQVDEGERERPLAEHDGGRHPVARSNGCSEREAVRLGRVDLVPPVVAFDAVAAGGPGPDLDQGTRLRHRPGAVDADPDRDVPVALRRTGHLRLGPASLDADHPGSGLVDDVAGRVPRCAVHGAPVAGRFGARAHGCLGHRSGRGHGGRLRGRTRRPRRARRGSRRRLRDRLTRAQGTRLIDGVAGDVDGTLSLPHAATSAAAIATTLGSRRRRRRRWR